MTFNPEFTGAELTDDQFNQLWGVLGSDEWAFAFSAMLRRWPQLAELVRSNAPDLPDDLVDAVEILSAKPLPTSGMLIMPDGSTRPPTDARPIPGTVDCQSAPDGRPIRLQLDPSNSKTD